MGYSGNAYAFRDKKELKIFKKKGLEFDPDDRIGKVGNMFHNLMSDYYGYSTDGNYTVTYEQLEELRDMTDGVLKKTFEDLLEVLDGHMCSVIYVEGSY